jgi:hypothetical protein
MVTVLDDVLEAVVVIDHDCVTDDDTTTDSVDDVDSVADSVGEAELLVDDVHVDVTESVYDDVELMSAVFEGDGELDRDEDRDGLRAVDKESDAEDVGDTVPTVPVTWLVDDKLNDGDDDPENEGDSDMESERVSLGEPLLDMLLVREGDDVRDFVGENDFVCDTEVLLEGDDDELLERDCENDVVVVAVGVVEAVVDSVPCVRDVELLRVITLDCVLPRVAVYEIVTDSRDLVTVTLGDVLMEGVFEADGEALVLIETD